MGRTAVASQQLHQDGRPGHPVQHAHCCGLHPHVIRLNTSLQLRVCNLQLTFIVPRRALNVRAAGLYRARTSRYTSLVPRPPPSFPLLAVPYCKRREAGRGPGNEAKGTQGWHKLTMALLCIHYMAFNKCVVCMRCSVLCPCLALAAVYPGKA